MTALVGVWLSLSDVVSGPAVFAALASLGMLGGILGTDLFGLFGDSDESDESDDDSADDDPFGDDLGDDFGGGGDDWDDFDDMDEGFGGMGDETDESLDELTHRVDELETEVASVSSSMSTVRSENEQISESLEDVEGNIRSLLDIYEMVTRGVNPFVDDVQENAGGSFGLFDNDDRDEATSEVGDEIANADAESFFDDDFDDSADDDADDGEFDDDEFGDGLEDDGLEDDEEFDDMDDTDDGDGGMSFEELKAEYDSGEAGWDEGDAESSEDAEETVADLGLDDGEFGETGDFDDALTADDAAGADAEDSESVTAAEEHGDSPATATADDVTAVELGADVEESDTDGSDHEGTTDDPDDAAGATDEPPEKPYLTSLPDGYLADLVVLEWLEFLVTEGGTATAIDAIRYYGDIEWIGPDVEDELTTYITGFSAIEPQASGPLSIRQHKESLIYVCQLAEGVPESPSERRAAPQTSPPVSYSTTATNGRADVQRPDGGTDGL